MDLRGINFMPSRFAAMSCETSYLGWMVFGDMESYHIHHHTVFSNSEQALSLRSLAESRETENENENVLFKLFSSLVFLQSCCEE